MAYRQNRTALTPGETLVTVPFGYTFTGVPTVVVSLELDPAVAVPGDISVVVVDRTDSQFVVLLSRALPDGDHFLNWTAGTDTLEITPEAFGVGRLLPDYERLKDEPSQEDDIPIVHRPSRGGRPELRLLGYRLLSRFFPSWRSVPASPASAADSGAMAASGAHVYVRTSDGWGRVALQRHTWDPNFVEGVSRPMQEGVASLITPQPGSTTSYEIVFPTAFPLVPWVHVTLECTTASAPVLTAMVTEVTKGRFVVRLSAAPASGVVYRARWLARCAEPAIQAGVGGATGSQSGAAYLKTEADARFLRHDLFSAYGYVASDEAGTAVYKTAPANSILGRLGSGLLAATAIAANRFLARGSGGGLEAKVITDDALAFLAGYSATSTIAYASGANSSGNTMITPASLCRVLTYVLTVSGTAGTRIVVLDASSLSAGRRLSLVLRLPTTAAIVVEVRNATTGGTLLATLTTDTSGDDANLHFYDNGTAWEAESSKYPTL